MELSRALRLPGTGTEPEICIRLQCQPPAELSSAKGCVNNWLTVTNQVPPVNDAKGHFGVTEG